MSCKLPFLRKSLLSSLVIAGLSTLSITWFGVAVAPALIVPAGSYSTTFKVTASKPSVRTTGMPVLKQITLAATPANGTSASVSTSVPFSVPTARPPGGPNGTRQF